MIDKEEKVVLFGAGSCGSYALRFLREKGIEPVAFADNEESKHGMMLDNIGIMSPQYIHDLYPDATFVATAMSRPAATEIRAEIKAMGVKTMSLWECIIVHHGLPPDNIRDSLFPILGSVDSQLEFNDQIVFRKNPDYDSQLNPADASETYFPDFIKRLDNERFADCGANNGDSIKPFLDKWKSYERITAFEPDPTNFAKLKEFCSEIENVIVVNAAVGDCNGTMNFSLNGDWSSHADKLGSSSVPVTKLDDFFGKDNAPTYIKFDIEGFEPQALWGARRILKEHKPVLAICAYHESDHLWMLPLLIHALQPEYTLHLKRYAEGAWELVYYAVPKDRLISDPWSEVSYSDNHTG